MSKMGTNYYLREDYCRVCGRFEQHHIGKSSAGWMFLFNVTDKEKVDDWKKETLHYKNWSDDEGIFDEYGKQKSYDDFWKMVEDKQDGKTHSPHGFGGQRSWIDEDGYNVANYDFS